MLGTTGVETASGVVSPAKDAGLKSGDIIVRAGGKEFETANELVSLISGSGGKPISIAYLRDGKEDTVTVTPARDTANGSYRIGVLVRDSTAVLIFLPAILIPACGSSSPSVSHDIFCIEVK